MDGRGRADRERFASGAAAHTTNQRMEVLAVIEALRENDDNPIEIVSDSSYVVKCFHDKWYVGWLRRGWKNSQGQARRQPRPLGGALRAGAGPTSRDIRFSWVKGHSGDAMNDFVDVLATRGGRPPTRSSLLSRATRIGDEPTTLGFPRGFHYEIGEGTDRDQRGPAVRCRRHRGWPRRLRRRPLRRLGRAQRRHRRA